MFLVARVEVADVQIGLECVFRLGHPGQPRRRVYVVLGCVEQFSQRIVVLVPDQQEQHAGHGRLVLQVVRQGAEFGGSGRAVICGSGSCAGGQAWKLRAAHVVVDARVILDHVLAEHGIDRWLCDDGRPDARLIVVVRREGGGESLEDDAVVGPESAALEDPRTDRDPEPVLLRTLDLREPGELALQPIEKQRPVALITLAETAPDAR